MKRRTGLILAVAVASFHPSVLADEDIGLSKQLSACKTTANSVTEDLIACMIDEAKKQDVRLNKAYKDAMAPLEPGQKDRLREAQRAWVKFRDTNCAFYDDPGGGSFARLLANDCVMSSTARRAKELEGLKPDR